MKWLVTFEKPADRDSIVEQLRSLGCQISVSQRSVALTADDGMLSVEGPANLPELAKKFNGAIKVYPNSKMSAY